MVMDSWVRLDPTGALRVEMRFCQCITNTMMVYKDDIFYYK